MIYLDNNATTPLADEVSEAMLPFLREEFGNPSSAYSLSGRPKNAIEKARENIATLLGSSSAAEIVFTGSGTESDNWAILGSLEYCPDRKHIITTRVEHEAIRRLCEKLENRGYRVSWLDVDGKGELDLEQLKAELCDDTAIVSVMWANNETGVIFPVKEIAEIVKNNSNAVFHVDAVNAAGKVKIDVADVAIDLLSISAHKFCGPKGIGALFIRDGIDLPSMLIGGGQEKGRRAGTEAVHQIVGMGTAAMLAFDLQKMDDVRLLRDKLENALLSLIPDSFVNGSTDRARRLPNTSNMSFENTNGEMILHRLDEMGICVSTGSACNSESKISSPVLAAMDVPYSRAMGSIRFSLGRTTTESDIDKVISVLPNVVSDLRSLAK